MSRKKKQAKTLEELLAEALVPKEEQPYELPENWVWVRLGVLDSGTKSRSMDPKKYPDETFELYSVPSFPHFPEIIKGSEIGSSKQTVEENDILLCKINPRINRVWIVNVKKDHKQIASTEWIVVSPEKNVSPKYLLWTLRSPFFRDVLTSNVSGVGGSLTRARPKEVMTYSIPLPPFPEQKRIVDRVESLLGKIDEAKELVEGIPGNMEGHKRAIIEAAVSGELTTLWRENHSSIDSEEVQQSILQAREGLYQQQCEQAVLTGKKKPRKFAVNKDPLDMKDLPSIPDSWVWERLINIAHIQGGVTKGRKLKGDTVSLPYLRVANVQDGYLDLKEIKEIEILENEVEKYLLKEGDVLFTEGGDRDKLGRGTVWKNEVDQCIYQNHIFRARVYSTDLLPEFVSLVTKSHYAKKYFYENASQSVNLASINLTTLGNTPIPIPPLEEQKLIVERVTGILQLLEMVEENYEEVSTRIELLTQSILTQAFRGELGTNDPGEESALELLKRTLAEQNGLAYQSPATEELQVAEQGELYLT